MLRENRYPFLRGDTLFIRQPEGAVVKDHRGSYLIKGESSYAWLSAMSPLLDGSRTMDQLASEIPENLAPTARRLVSALCDRGTVVMVDEPGDAQGPTPLSETESFLSRWTPAPRAAQRRLGTARVAVLGAGSVGETLKQNGADGVVSCEDADAVLAGAWDWVVATSREVRWEDLERLSDAATAGRFRLLTIVELAGHLVVGPVVDHEGPRRGLGTLVHLTLRNADDATRLAWWERRLVGSVARSEIRPSVWEIVSVSAAFELFRLVTEFLPSRLDSSALFVDAGTLDASFERVVDPFALGPVGAAPGRAVEDRPGEPGSAAVDDLLQLLSPRLGIVTGVDDDEIIQEPLFLARVSHGWVHPDVPHPGTAVHRESLATARREALLSALASCAAVADDLGPVGGPARASTPSVVAAGVDLDDATDRARWLWVRERMLAVALRSAHPPARLAGDLSALDERLLEYLHDRGSAVETLLWPELPVPFVVAAAVGPDGAAEHWTCSAAPTIAAARSAALDLLAGWRQSGGALGDPAHDRIDLSAWLTTEGARDVPDPVDAITGIEAVARAGGDPRAVDITPPEIASTVRARVVRHG